MTTATLTVTHPVTGETLPPFLTARQAAVLLGRPEMWVGLACARGELPALPHTEGAPWSIPTLELLRVAGFALAPPPAAKPTGADTRPVGERERDGAGPDADPSRAVATTPRPVQSTSHAVPLRGAAATARTRSSDTGRARRGPGDKPAKRAS